MEKMKDNSTFGVSLEFCESIRLEEENISELFSKGFQIATKNTHNRQCLITFLLLLLLLLILLLISLLFYY